MSKTITFELQESETHRLESLIDETLEILRKIERESPQRDARIDQMQMRTERLMDEIEKRLNATWEHYQNGRKFVERPLGE